MPYESMRLMGHDVWIITSKYGKERTTEGHVIRLGTGFAFPANGSMGRVTLSWRFKERARELLAEHRFDILHFHEPFVPFLSPTVLDQSDTVQHRHLPRLRRILAVVLGREPLRRPPRRQAPRPDRGERRGATLSSTATSPATTRSSRTGSTWTDSPTPNRSMSCATARSTSSSSAASRSARG